MEEILNEEQAIKTINEAIQKAFVESKSGSITRISTNAQLLEVRYLFRFNWKAFSILLNQSREEHGELYDKYDELENLKYTAMLHSKEYSALHKELAEFKLQIFSKTQSHTQPITIKVIDKNELKEVFKNG